MKRIFDICVSLISLIALFPLFFIIIFLIRLTSKGPAFFKQERMGLNGKPFSMLKFRTMRIHDDSKYVQTVENDKRITFVGKYLRKSSIDELPQLFNILIGDMSIVGPRPVVLPLNEKYNAAYDLINRNILSNPDKIAFIDNNNKITYNELFIKVKTFAQSIRNIDIKPNDRV